MGNEIYNSYGKAFGIEPAVIENIGTVTMDTEGHGNISNSNNNSVTNNNTSRIQHIVSSNDTLSRSKVVNITAYQTAQALAGQALETFNKNLKRIGSGYTASKQSCMIAGTQIALAMIFVVSTLPSSLFSVRFQIPKAMAQAEDNEESAWLNLIVHSKTELSYIKQQERQPRYLTILT